MVPQEAIQSFLKTAEILEIKGLLESCSKKRKSDSPNKHKSSKNSELTVTSSLKFDTDPAFNVVMYNQMNMNTLKCSRSNPLIKAYEANNKRKSSETSPSSSHSQETKKSSRAYEASAPVFDNRNLYPVDLMQSDLDYSGRNIFRHYRDKILFGILELK